jgi:superfamily II DNA or RNA helicase
MKFTARDYQLEGLQQLRENYDAGRTNLLGTMATGMGKTTGIAANVPDTFPELTEHRNGEGGILFLAHRIEIIRQSYEKFVAMYPDKWIALEQANNHATGYEDMIFASVDSIGRLMSNRIFKYGKRKFGVVITDEGHHATVDSTWDNILTFFGVGSDRRKRFRLKSGARPLSLFLTATPERADGKSMAPFIDRCDTETGAAFNYDILYGIRNGWLVDIRAFQAGMRGGDLADLEIEEQVDYLIKTYTKYASGLKTLVFARSVAQSQLLADTLNAAGLCVAAHVDANTDKEERVRAITSFKEGGEGSVSMISNRFVYTEGFDEPSIQCIIDNAPTESRSLHIQKLGRGLRPSPDAQVDLYKTPEERRAAIKASSKEALLYLATFDPSIHGITIVGAIWNNREINAEGHRVVEEVIDVIELEEAERPERPIRDITAISELDIVLRSVNVWTQTIENDDLKALTPLRWVIDNDNASIFLPVNPSAKSAYERTPVIYRFEKNGEVYEMKRIVVGGWVEELGFPVAARVTSLGFQKDLNYAIRTFDAKLQVEYPNIYSQMKRGAPSPATAAQLKYMKNHSIKHGPVVSEETASILIEHFKIQRKLKSLKL